MAKILLAEDEEVLRMLVVDTLEDEGHEVEEARDGEEAIQLITEHDYDLILLDYMMPIYTGLDVIERVRNQLVKTEAKIMMLSAKSQRSDQQKVMEAGANYFMSKPFSPKELVDRIEEILGEN
jgi:two-component system, OmpR family, phosphate regulon response regulator PhoB